MIRRSVVSGLIVVALTACATPIPPSPAVTSLEGRDCSHPIQPDRALETTPEKAKVKHHRVMETLAGGSLCSTDDEGRAFTYAVFALPDTEERPMLLTAGAVREPLRVVPPRVMMVDEAGQVRVTKSPGDAKTIGGVLGFQIRLRPYDALVVVASDPAFVGEQRTRVETNMFVGTGSTYNAPTGVSSSYNTYSGAAGEATRTGSFEGPVIVAFDWPRDKK